MTPDDFAAGVQAVDGAIRSSGIVGTLIAIAVLAVAVFLVRCAWYAGKIMAETYTISTARSLSLVLAHGVAAFAAAMTRRRNAAEQVADEALAMLDDYATDGQLSGTALLRQAVSSRGPRRKPKENGRRRQRVFDLARRRLI